MHIDLAGETFACRAVPAAGNTAPDEHYSRAFWDERYGSAEKVWSGNPNPHLVACAADLAPGSALDVGCGEGADAIWLASLGWTVTAMDVSPIALERAARFAQAAGAEIAARISWEEADIFTWDPAPRQFDLVTSQFMHLPSARRASFHGRMAAAVRAGGTLLIVGHHIADTHHAAGRTDIYPDVFFSGEEIAATLDPADWEQITADSPERPGATAAGKMAIHTRDALLRAVRRR